MPPVGSIPGSRLVFALAVLVASAGCSQARPRSSVVHEEEDRRRPPVVEGEVRVIDREAPLDVRLLRIEPALHVGNERVCSVRTVGRAQDGNGRTAARYPFPVASRRLLRCAAETGDGWVDLVFPVPTAALVGMVTPGKRLRVKVVASSGGFDDLPIVEFVALLGETPLPEGGTSEVEGLTAGFNFGDVAGLSKRIGEIEECSLSFAGLPEPLGELDRARYPESPTHRLNLVCLHGRGDAWVELLFDAKDASNVLALRRGQRPRLRIVASRGGRADYPVVSLVETPDDV